MVSFTACFQSLVLFPPFLIAAPVEPVVLIEYQAKCNYGWNSCFVGANNLPWHGTQWNGNEGDRVKGVSRDGAARPGFCAAGRARCVIKTLIIQSITNAIIGGRAGRGGGAAAGARVGHPVILEFDSG